MRGVKYTTETYKKAIKQLPHGNKIKVLGSYVKGRIKILHQCLECNHKWYTKPGVILRGAGCPACNTRNRTWTHEDYLEQLKAKHQGYLICLEQYRGANHFILHRCLRCSTDWETSPYRALRATNCPICADRHRGTKVPLTTYEKKLRRIHGSTIQVLEYNPGSRQKSRYKCHLCHHRWAASTQSVTSGCGCPSCAQSRKRKHPQQYLREVRHMHGNTIKVLEKYVGANSAIRHQCVKNHTWKAEPSMVIRGSGCPVCARQKAFQPKDFKLGDRFVQVQGYEPQAILWILANTEIPAENIKTSANDNLPVVPYHLGGRNRKYYPDLWIPIRNILVEVKSLWTFCGRRSRLEMTQAKAKACLKAGFRFKLLVMDPAGSRLPLPHNWYHMEPKRVRDILHNC